MLLKGFLLGLAISAPIGVIGLWCIERSINYGFRYGFATGFGAVVADMLFAVLAAIGFSQIIEPLIKDNPWPAMIGAAFIIYMGIQTLRKASPNNAIQLSQNPSITKSFLSSFVLIMTHPAAILIFLGVFTGLGIELNEQTPWLTVGQLLIGMLLGGVSWWLFLSGLASYLGKKMTPTLMRKFNIVSGSMVMLFGLWLGVSAWFH
ncbi:MAG: LysE family transporter [Gammaproteobacteria bacterium]|nr:LysE family transporter [Gammaproteobacteria bacterium]